jgi:predicted PurR-regulated permease PerM
MKKHRPSRVTMDSETNTGKGRGSPLPARRTAMRGRIAWVAAQALRAGDSQSRLPVVAAIAVWILAVIALIVFLKWAHGLLVPLLLGIILTYTLAPFVKWLEMRHIHRAVGALLVLTVMLGGVSWIGVALSGEVQAVADQLPDVARKLTVKIRQVSAGDSNIFRKMRDAAGELDKAASETAAPKGAKIAPAPAAAPGTPVSSALASWFAANINVLMQGAAQAVLIVLLAYSLLAAGPLFRRKLMALVGPNLSSRKEALRTLDELQQQMQSYFLWLMATNALIGLGIWGAFSALGVENPGFWGAAAALLHFIPYAGPLLLGVASGITLFVQTGSYTEALTVAGVAIAVNGVIGVGVLTWMQARVYRVSAAALFLSMLFFGWLWGAWGVLLAAPLTCVMKVVCDRVPALERFAVVLSP